MQWFHRRYILHGATQSDADCFGYGSELNVGECALSVARGGRGEIFEAARPSDGIFYYSVGILHQERCQY